MGVEGYNVLYVDDDESNLNSFKLQFRRKFNIITANSGKKGLEILESQPIHLIITDQKMPNMTGVQFLKIVKEKWPEPKYILLTGFTDHEIIKEAINDVGIYWYVNKPFDPDQMEYLIGKGIDNYRKEQAKKAVDDMLHMVLNTALDGIITINEEQLITMANPAIIKLFGYEEEELIGQRIEVLIPDEVEGHKQLAKSFGSLDQPSNIMMLGRLVYGKAKTGELIPVEIAISKMELNGEQFYNAILRDVSQRIEAEKLLKESEEKFRGVFNSVVDVFTRTDMKGKCVMISPSVYDLFGYRDDEVIGHNVSLFFNNREDERKFGEAIVEKGALKDYRIEGRKKDGTKIVMSLNSKIYRDKDGNPLGIESLIRDVTEQYNAERKIREMNEELETKVHERTLELEKAKIDIMQALSKEKELGELKSRFVATASHQFRTPLTVIQSNVELLEMSLNKLEDKLKHRFEKSFERINKESNRMTELMNDVLILGKINAGVTATNKEMIDVAVIAKDLTDRLNEVNYSQAKINLEIENTPRMAFLDEKQYSHVLLNILSNAQKYSLDRGDITFKIHFGNKNVKMMVIDHGIGMSEEDMKDLFQPFSRGKNTEGIQGTGLGMSIAHEYIMLNGGDVMVDSKLNEGTTVTMIFNYNEN